MGCPSVQQASPRACCTAAGKAFAVSNYQLSSILPKMRDQQSAFLACGHAHAFMARLIARV